MINNAKANYSDELLNLTSDLHRIAIALANNSSLVAQRFTQEAQKRQQNLDPSNFDPYTSRLLGKIKETLINPDLRQKADDCLMYSTLLQNYILKNPLDNKNQPS